MFNRIRNQVSGNGGFTIIELVAVLVVLGIIVSFAVARMSDNSNVFKQKAVVPLVNALNTHETGAFANGLLANDGGFPNTSALASMTFDLDGINAHVKGDYSYPSGVPIAQAEFDSPGVTISYMNNLGTIMMYRECLDKDEQCRWDYTIN